MRFDARHSSKGRTRRENSMLTDILNPVPNKPEMCEENALLPLKIEI